jgi:sensor histidine kinase regulating citrate/malate metabolism
MCILSFVLVIKGADFLVSGVSTAVKHLCISDMVLGLTVVSFGTSLPESLIYGLNLAIVQKCIEFHDGTISVQSDPGRGTTFRVSLPCS